MSVTWGSMRRSNEIVNLLGVLLVCIALWASNLAAQKPAPAIPAAQLHEHTDIWVEPAPAEPPVVHDYDQDITVTPGSVEPAPAPQFYTSDMPHNVLI